MGRRCRRWSCRTCLVRNSHDEAVRIFDALKDAQVHGKRARWLHFNAGHFGICDGSELRTRFNRLLTILKRDGRHWEHDHRVLGVDDSGQRAHFHVLTIGGPFLDQSYVAVLAERVGLGRVWITEVTLSRASRDRVARYQALNELEYAVARLDAGLGAGERIRPHSGSLT